ncbi:HEAT repeat domain-containing protein [Gordonia amicalis]|uniref:HEAT repeat domain-containing protein n=1 Tax=Gordonia amicalis TaxID=89053 RepID=UPI0024BB8381|nr:HEAT repeat domain-containing protein [Gordonia amicalis]MDJ0454947.1 HEAT repeat domain-containing protein [Gordonia amicalis]MDV7078224.1 HEAT repeat domain-containing protein [Gordonia amicalis]MDV7101356.1 HEAT repeat domain-containing protein [Gordonia amicalis]
MLIGEVARRSGVSTRMLRHYDTLGLVRPTGRTTGGYREYSDADIERLLHVESLRSLGLSLRDVGRALDDPGFAPDALLERMIQDTEDRMAADARLLDRLRQIEAADADDWSAVLDVVGLLRAVHSEYAAHRQRAALRAGDAGLSAEALTDALLAESDPNTAGALRWALAQTSGALDQLAARVADHDPTIRRRAITALASIEDARATAVLEGALTDPDPEVRRTVARALGRRGVDAAVDVLIELVAAGDRDVEAAETLATYADDDRIVGLLVDRLGGDPDPSVRLRLVQALAEIAGDAASKALIDLGDDADETVARTARAIGSLRSP